MIRTARIKGFLVIGLGLVPGLLAAQSYNPETPFDDAPWVSARAAAMSEAVDPIANGLESAYYNPAAIGGLNYKQERNAVSQLYFPYLGAAYNKSGQSLNKALQGGSDIGDSSVANELLQGYDGEHPYARVSILPAITFYRFFLAYSYDVRATSTPNSSENDLLDVSYREQSGPIVGMSYGTPKRDFYLGVTAQYLNRSEVKGTFPLATMNDASSRKEAFRDSRHRYTGIPITVGSLWTGSYSWRPSVSLVARNVTSTVMKSSSEEVEDARIPEDLTLGFGMTPNLGKWGMLSLVLEAKELTQKSVANKDKLRFGSELTFGNAFGADAGFALRAGYSMAGISYGAGFNLGFFGLQLASFAEDIGTDSDRVIERRSVINFGINIAE